MELRNSPLQSGVSYTLYEFFGPKRTIVIPDLQRDYCWASTKIVTGDGLSLVEAYVDDLIFASQKGKDAKLKMGLLYGYEYPVDNVQLCDGQQRLTTLFLISGVCLNKLGEEDNIQEEEVSSIISQGNSSRLQYAIRDSSLSFINNLVQNGAFYPEITEEPWFSNEYRRDPSVCNMVLAIKQIDGKVTNAETAKKLLDYILHNISFLYFDMQSRTYSEEQYVILNTTGYSLTPTEHVKPKLLGKLRGEQLAEYSERWESWEQFIWDHRPTDDDNFTVDEWFDRFLTIFYLAENIDKEISYSDKESDYTPYQRVLQGSRKYTFPAETEAEAITSLGTIHHYFETAILIDNLNLSVTLDIGSGKIPSKSIWEYISNSADWSNLSNLQQVVSIFIQLKKYRNKSFDTISAWANRILEFAWVQSRYKSENQDICHFLSFVAKLNLHGESIYSLAAKDSLFSNGLQTKKFPLVADIENESPISDMEKALQLLAHLQTSRGRISYALDIFENPQPQDIFLLAQNLATTTDRPNTLLRRALMTYGAYWYENGWCNWGKRYEFASSANYFYNQTHDKQDDIILSFIKDIAKENNVIEHLQKRIAEKSPVLTDDSRLNHYIKLLFLHKEYFDVMKSGRIAVDSHNAYAMFGPNAIGDNYRTIMDPKQRDLVEKTKSLLDESWNVWDEFTIAKAHKKWSDMSLTVRVTGDWHISDDKLEFRSYVSVDCNDDEWAEIKIRLLEVFPESHYKDDANKYLHIKVLNSSSHQEAASLLQSIYDRLV